MLKRMKGKMVLKEEVAKGTMRVEFALLEPIKFSAGQYVTIGLPAAGLNDARGLTRDFSIVNPPTRNNKVVITTRLRESAFKKTLAELPVGTEVEIDYPSGQFTLPEETSRSLVFIAGGIGITPFMSMITYAAEIKTGHNITLIYSNRDRESAVYLDELQRVATENDEIKLVATMTRDPSWSGEKRRIDTEFIKSYFPDPDKNTYMIAGSAEMVEGVFKSLVDAGVDPLNIKSEDFAGY